MGWGDFRLSALQEEILPDLDDSSYVNEQFAPVDNGMQYDTDSVTYESTVHARPMSIMRLRPSEEHDPTSGTPRGMYRLPELHRGPAGSGERRIGTGTTGPVRLQQRSTWPRHLARRKAEPESSSGRTTLYGIDESDESTAAPTSLPGQSSPQQVARKVHQGHPATVSEPRRLRNAVGHRAFALARTERAHLTRDDRFHWQPDWEGTAAGRQQ